MKLHPEVLLVFLRYPEAGAVKTRLIPKLGEVAAARLYRRIAEQVVDETDGMVHRGLSRVAVVSPPGMVSETKAWLGDRLNYLPEAGYNLATHLEKAFDHAFDCGAKRVVAIGTDCIDLRVAHLRKAFSILHRKDFVLGPAEDGGVTVIGLRKPRPEIFAGIAWGTDHVFEQLKAKLLPLNASVEFLQRLRDIDRYEDVVALAPAWPDLLGEFVS
ncbi:MAG: TIGR04282 family arsenosugar biosynthesis glycosyltransferase [Planctomycetota bacterium]